MTTITFPTRAYKKPSRLYKDSKAVMLRDGGIKFNLSTRKTALRSSDGNPAINSSTRSCDSRDAASKGDRSQSLTGINKLKNAVLRGKTTSSPFSSSPKLMKKKGGKVLKMISGLGRRKEKLVPESCDDTTSTHSTGHAVEHPCSTSMGFICTKPSNTTGPPKVNNSIEDVYEGVHQGRILGTGASGTVRLVRHRETGAYYAVKCIDLSRIEENGLKRFREEIYIMCQIDHPNIIRLEEVYESSECIYLVMEVCCGGELFDCLDDQPDCHYTEEQTQVIVKQMLAALQYLHSKGIIHRDLKLENFLFCTDGDDLKLKLIDFGLSKFIKVGELSDELVGTPYTVSPELLRRQYDERCDVWAIGVIAYLLLSGDTPFGGCDRDGSPVNFRALRANIMRAHVPFEPEKIWDDVSIEGKEFIKSLLTANPENRPSAAEAQRSSWLAEWTLKDPSTNQLFKPKVENALYQYQNFTSVRKLLCKTLTCELYPFWFVDLQPEFQKLDRDDCEIDYETFSEYLGPESNKQHGDDREDNINDICGLFRGLCLRENVDTFQRQDFYAAGLELCGVDDLNICYAFNRIDGEGKGFIDCDDIVRTLQNNENASCADSIRDMYSIPLGEIEKMDGGLCREEFLLMVRGIEH
eukprot:CAMPEP_0172520576 /NCGR_PEP_ID=MMETSP1066-20121228/292086_1 /TAXON_ID=671091 /ORGANISM="Coscinodiscus wailesii, Strain CCMP2513" /LENGTH=637 /DNA_ID=CAMNT_0013303363 /DNA_START=32 /DNA_END=1945 /DNA_ORIENTATION=-